MELTAQQLFDTVVNHLRAQKSKSVAFNSDGSVKMELDSVVCLYRSTDGKKCAAGAVITDEEYRPEMEGVIIRAVIDNFNLLHLQPHLSLLGALQQVHDGRSIEEWEYHFKRLADDFNLTYTSPTAEGQA